MKIFNKGFGLLLLLLLMAVPQLKADKNDGVPVDPNVRKGQLENGLTYYIRHNKVPEKRAEFYLFVNAGASLEEANQNGLAHFCEHMAFNGTKHFPDKEVLNYMESIGVKFGHNVNAFTSTEMTVYNLAEVPTKKESVIDSSLLVLLDWANFVTYDNEEIDKERGVIHEEWRTRRTPDMRLMLETSKALYKGSKLAEHDVIGKLDIIDNCDYETLKSYYKDWYRPDLQAIAVVGDIDVDAVEAKIREKFSVIEMPENPKERYTVELPDNIEPLVAVATDKEASRSFVHLYYKHDPAKSKDMTYYRESLKQSLYSTMFNDRMDELTQNADNPFIFGAGSYSSLTRSKDAYHAFALAKNDKIKETLETLLKENERVKRYGFTRAELERSKVKMLSNLEKQYNNRNKTKSRNYIWSYLSNFMTGEPVPGIEFEYVYAKKELPNITLEEVNALPKKWITDKNMVVTVTGPENENIAVPVKEEVLALIDAAKSDKVEAYKEEAVDKPLLAEAPVAGKILSEDRNDELGVTTWKLENGAKVIIKPTEFKENEILMSVYSPGGSSLVMEEDVPSARMLTALMMMAGVGDHSYSELKKKLTGKNVNVYPQLGETFEGFSGSCEPKDFETLLTLTHMYFEHPRKDEKATEAYLSRLSAFYANKNLDPNNIFRDSISFILANYHPYREPLSSEYLQRINVETLMEVYKDRFRDASDFTFFFVGNLNLDETKALVEKYIGSIKDEERNEKWKNLGIRPPKGNYKTTLEKEMKVSKASVYVNYNGDFDFTLEDRIKMQAIEHILGLRYTETIREERGGSYGVRVSEYTSKIPQEIFSLSMQFDCDPEKMEDLKSIVFEEVEKLFSDGPSETDLKKATEYFLKTREENLKENRFWLNALERNYKYGDDNLDTEVYTNIVNSLTVEDIRAAAEKYLKNANTVEVVMLPKQ